MRSVIFVILFFFIPTSFAAHGSADETQTRQTLLFSELRCLVCQNESLADSNAPLAKDLREKIDVQLAQGKSNDEIKRYLITRYGEFILFKPSMSSKNSFLWFGPVIFLVIGFIALFFVVRRHKESASKMTLSEQEKNQLKELLQ